MIAAAPSVLLARTRTRTAAAAVALDGFGGRLDGPELAGARDLLLRTWTGLAALQAIEAIDDERRCARLVGAAMAAAATALGVLAVALDGAAADAERADRAAVLLADDPGLAAPGARDIAALRSDSAARVAAADAACADRLDALVGAARIEPFPRRVPDIGVFGGFRSPWGPDRSLLAGRDTVDDLSEPPVPQNVRSNASADVVRDPAPVARDLARSAADREVASALARAGVRDALAAAVDGLLPRFLFWDPHAGHAVELIGDLADAQDVVVYVPGTGTSLTHWGATAAALAALHAALSARVGPHVALVAWYGADAPPNVAAAALQSYAKRAAPRLAVFVRSLPLAPSARVTLVGHSYGGTTAGLAVHEGLRPAALVGLAAPGFGPGVNGTRDLGGVPTYVLVHPDDPIRAVPVVQRVAVGVLGAPFGPAGSWAVDRLSGAAGLGHLGREPATLPGALRLSTGADDHGPPPALPAGTGIHGSYLLPGTVSLEQVVSVAAGDPPRPYRR